MSQPIQFVHRGLGQIEAVEAAGYRLREEGGQWWADDPVAVQAIIDGYTDAHRHAWELQRVTAAIRHERERRQLEDGFPVTLPGLGVVRFHSDTHSRSQQAGLFSAANTMLMQGATLTTAIASGGQQVTWQTMSGQQVPLSVGVVLALMQAAMANEGAVHAAAAAHIAAAAASASPLAYDFMSSGWPA